MKPEDLNERRLIIYQITPDTYNQGLERKNSNKNDDLYKLYNPNQESFKIVLIGLDAGIKLESNQFLTSTQIFDKINQMLMRRQELRNQN